MRAAGIVAEYDPFHLGHAWHIAQTRQRLGAETPVVCVMSGSWTQRGECALTDKWTRAALAIQGGADLVLELPLPWALASAEGFARGAVETLAATGVVDTLSFGSECGDIEALAALAGCLDSPAYRDALAQELDKGISFADARQRAVQAALTAQNLPGEADLLSHPNNNLGVEYLRAAARLGGEMKAITVPRRGAAHNSTNSDQGFASATAVRAMARAGEWEALAQATPGGTAQALQQAGITDMKYVERAILARLRTMDEQDFARLPDSAPEEGLPRRLVRAAEEACTLEEFYTLAKTRRYAHARLRRIAVRAFLGVTAETLPQSPRYLRVLGMNDRGKALLRRMRETARLPVIVKPAHVLELDEQAQSLFQLESRGLDLFGLCFAQARPCGLDYRTTPVVL